MRLRTSRRAVVVTGIACAGVMVASGLALGTPGSDAVGTQLARGTAHEKIKTRGGGSFDVVTQRIVFQPGGHSGWHSHPGQAVVTILTGSLTFYEADDPTCAADHRHAGQVFVDDGYGDSHIARNEGSVAAEVIVTYLDVPVGQPFRIDMPNPGNCPF